MLLVHVVNLWWGAVETAHAEAPPTLVSPTPRSLICLYSNKPSFEIQTILRSETIENMLHQFPNSLLSVLGRLDGDAAAQTAHKQPVRREGQAAERKSHFPRCFHLPWEESSLKPRPKSCAAGTGAPALMAFV